MSALLQPFVFKYMDAGEMKTLEFIPDGSLLPVSRIVNCLGMNWRNNHERVRVYKSFQTLKFSGRSQREAALDGEDFISWLLSVNRLKVKKPELVKHFQEHFPILWRNYRYEVENPHPEVEAIGDRSEDDPEYKAIMQEMGIDTDTTIYVDKDLSKPDRYIRLLAKFKHMDPTGLRYYLSLNEVRLCQEIPKDKQKTEGKAYSLDSHPFKLEISGLRYKIRQGYLPDYVFYLEYPEYYDKELIIQIALDRNKSAKPVRKLRPIDISPLLTPEYYGKVQKRKQEDEKIMIENFKREVDVDNDTDISECGRKKWDFSSLGIPQKSDYDPNYGTARAWSY